MAIEVKCKDIKSQEKGLTLAQIQKTSGIFCDIRHNDGMIVNVLGTKASCFYCDDAGFIEAVDWSTWKDIKFKLADKEITLSNE